MRRLFIIGIVVLALALMAGVLDAGEGSLPKLKKATLPGVASPPRPLSPRFVVLPPWLDVTGKSLAEWQRAGFKWTSRIPTDGPQPHPQLAEGEVDCSYAQRGLVWFLESGRVQRSCSIPLGEIVYVPVNLWFCIPEADAIPFAECEAKGDPYLEEAIATLTVDGRRIDLRAWRTHTGRFTAKLAEENIWEFLFGGDLGPTTEISSDGMGALVMMGRGTHTLVGSVTFDFDRDGIPDTVETSSYEIRVTR